MSFYRIDDSTQGAPLEVRAVLALVQRFKVCEDTNQQIADKLGMTYYAVAKAIKVLSAAEIINVKYCDGKNRILTVDFAKTQNCDFAKLQNRFCENAKSKLRKRKIETAKTQNPSFFIKEEILEEVIEEYSPQNLTDFSQKKDDAENVKISGGKNGLDEEREAFLEGWQNHWRKTKNCGYCVLSDNLTDSGTNVLRAAKSRLESEKIPFTAENVESYFDALFSVADEWQKSNWDLPIINKQINRLYAAVNRKKTELQRLADATATLGF